MNMKRLLWAALLLSLMLGGCAKKAVPELPPPSYNPDAVTPVDPDADDEEVDGGEGEGGEVVPPTPTGDWEKNRGKIVRPTGEGWTSKTIDEGIVYYTFDGKDDISGQVEQAFVIDLDLSNPNYEVHLTYTTPSTATSNVFKAHNAVVTMNAGYELGSIFVRSNGILKSMLQNIEISNTGVPNWKSEAAFYGDGERNLRIAFSGKGMTVKDQRTYYLSTTDPDVVSSAPMLVDDYNPVGETFCDYTIPAATVNKLNSEDPQRHQRVRHPRVAVALTEDNHFIMFTVDGRNNYSKGMSCRELTRFLVKHFNPQYALNMDGGGSTTLCVEGEGDPTTHVVNYPCDNNKYDHAGERARDTHFVIVRK